MYQYVWDAESGGLVLTTEQCKFSKEPRPVYYRELDVLGFDKYWSYPKNDDAPIMWAESGSYIYRGTTVAKVRGGSLYTAPEIMDVKLEGQMLQQVNIELMLQKNRDILETLTQETIQKVYNTYRKYKGKVDVFYVAFSGGKDSVVALDIVQRALPHDDFSVLFGDTRMEFPDTYAIMAHVEKMCQEQGIEFYRAQSRLTPDQTWKTFGPPATSNRWCCSVHKTSPQINLLRKLTGKNDFTGMAFTGVRAEESLSRSEYDPVSEGRKHSGQMSCHAILQWNSAELFLYMYERNLKFNEAYKKGISRAGCLVCPNSTGRHEYLKRVWYQEQVDFYIDAIRLTSGKTTYKPDEMKNFIESGFWRTRRSGRELNFGQDCFEVKHDSSIPTINVYSRRPRWEQWAKTIGDFSVSGEGLYVIKFAEKLYQVKVMETDSKITFQLPNCEKTKDDIRFQSLFRSAIIKGLYCVGCGVCEAECKNHCIDMSDRITIGDNCTHCHKCHDVHEHCLRYGSIRNKISEGRKMTGLDRYYTFGTRAQWLDIFNSYGGGSDFWMTDGDNQVPNKRKDAFKTFALDAGLSYFDKSADGDKYTKCLPTDFAEVVNKCGAFSQTSWALILCNLVYTPAFNWFVNNLKPGVIYSPDAIKLMLADVMDGDTKGLGRRNVVDSLKIFMACTPLGTEQIFAYCDIEEGKTIKMNSLQRCSWSEPVSEVILYALYKFAEECGGYYQFTLDVLLDDSIERDGVSPTKMFGLERDTMIRILNGLSINYPDFISASFTLDLDNITLRDDKTAADVLKLF